MQFDIRSISTAVAVNYGMLSVSKDLVRISHPSNNNLYIDTYYADMDPIYCILGDNGTDICVLLSSNNAWLYPVITQRNGNSTDICSCDGSNIDAKSENCSEMDVLIALIYFPVTYNDNVTSAWNSFISSVMRYRLDDSENGDLVFAKAVHNVQNGLTEHNAAELFLGLCGGNCTIISMSIWGGSYFKSINKLGVQMAVLYDSGNIHSCQETLYKSQAFDELLRKPPTKLVESFYVCRVTRATALQRAFGNAAGTADVFSMVVLSVLFTVLVKIYNRWFCDDRPLVDSDEKKVIVESVVLRLHNENKALKVSLALLELQLNKQQEAINLLLSGGKKEVKASVDTSPLPDMAGVDALYPQLMKEELVDGDIHAKRPIVQHDMFDNAGGGVYYNGNDQHDNEDEELEGEALYEILSDIGYDNDSDSTKAGNHDSNDD
jgi:hypothetical protein